MKKEKSLLKKISWNLLSECQRDWLSDMEQWSTTTEGWDRIQSLLDQPLPEGQDKPILWNEGYILKQWMILEHWKALEYAWTKEPSGDWPGIEFGDILQQGLEVGQIISLKWLWDQTEWTDWEAGLVSVVRKNGWPLRGGEAAFVRKETPSASPSLMQSEGLCKEGQEKAHTGTPKENNQTVIMQEVLNTVWLQAAESEEMEVMKYVWKKAEGLRQQESGRWRDLRLDIWREHEGRYRGALMMPALIGWEPLVHWLMHDCLTAPGYESQAVDKTDWDRVRHEVAERLKRHVQIQKEYKEGKDLMRQCENESERHLKMIEKSKTKASHRWL